MASNPLYSFFGKALIWLPVSFAFWYQFADLLILPLAPSTEAVLGVLVPRMVETVESGTRALVFVTRLEVTAGDGRAGMAVLEINPLVYSYNLPLLVALMLAAGESYFSFTRVVLCYVVLLPFQIWGVCFEFLKLITLQAGPEITAQVGISGWYLEGIALGYQFGCLMLPVISATALWILMNRRFIDTLLTQEHPQRG